MVTVKDPDGSEDDAPAGVVSLFDFTATDEESLFFKIELDIVFEGGYQLINPYHVVIAAPEKHPHVKIDLARKYSEFIRSEEGQNIIRNFKVHGEALFTPNSY